MGRRGKRRKFGAAGGEFSQGEFISPENFEIKGTPQGLQAQWETDFPWSMWAMMEKLRILD